MAGKIYWGPPGSYKTSAAVMDDVAQCAREGRCLITNIRGLSEARIREHAPTVAPGFSVIHLRRDTAEDMEKMRRWWHWAPEGAFIIFDEIQSIYPPDWTAKQMHELDMREPRFINGEEVARDVSLIFDMHRHGNWDWTFTTPSIRKVRPEIRAAAEVAYKHKNLAIHGSLPFMRGRFMQFIHVAEDNGNASNIFQHRRRKIAPWVFNCYDSTATGKVTDTKAGVSLLAHPRILGAAALVVLAGLVLGYVGLPRFMAGEAPEANQADPAPAAVDRAVSSRDEGMQRNRTDRPAVTTAAGIASERSQRAKPAAVDSTRWRYAGRIIIDGQDTVILDSQNGSRIIPAEICRVDAARQPVCILDGERITTWTGQQPTGIFSRAAATLTASE